MGEKMKILLLSPNQIKRRNWTHQLFRNEFAKHHDVLYYGDGFPDYVPEKPIPEIVKEKGPFDLIFTYGLKYTEPFIGIGDCNIPKIHIAVDYFPAKIAGNFERSHKLFNRDKYDLYFGTTNGVVKYLKSNGFLKSFLLPFSIDTNIYRNLNLQKDYDIFAVFTTRGKGDPIYPYRRIVHKILQKDLSHLKSFTSFIVHDEYIKAINRAKIGISSNNMFGSLSIKYVEVMSCGTMLMSDKPEDLEINGYQDGHHLVIYKDMEDMKNKIHYYLKHENEREKIAKNGEEFVRKYHNNEIRVQQFTDIVRKELGINA